MTRNSSEVERYLIQYPGWILLAYLVLAQAPAAFYYDWTVRWGLQESAEQITPIGVAFGTGCARADVTLYIPLLAVGLLFGTGLEDTRTNSTKFRPGARLCLASAMGMTLYWTLEYMYTLPVARASWQLGDERAYWVVLPTIAGWGLVVLTYLIVTSSAASSSSTNSHTTSGTSTGVSPLPAVTLQVPSEEAATCIAPLIRKGKTGQGGSA